MTWDSDWKAISGYQNSGSNICSQCPITWETFIAWLRSYFVKCLLMKGTFWKVCLLSLQVSFESQIEKTLAQNERENARDPAWTKFCQAPSYICWAVADPLKIGFAALQKLLKLSTAAFYTFPLQNKVLWTQLFSRSPSTSARCCKSSDPQNFSPMRGASRIHESRYSNSA